MKSSFSLPRLTATLVVLLTLSTPRLLLAAGANFHSARGAKIPSQYIVVLDPNVVSSPDSARAVRENLLAKHRGTKKLAWDTLTHGFSAELSEVEALALANEPGVAEVWENYYVYPAYYNQYMPPSYFYTLPNGSGQTVYLRPQWWLDRLDQESPVLAPLNGAYGWGYDGSGVNVYVLDTGIYWQHSEFTRVQGDPWPPATWQQSRVVEPDSLKALMPIQLSQYTPFTAPPSAAAAHGTQVASLINGWTNGVAKGATVIDAQVVLAAAQPYGQADWVIMALNWIKADVGSGAAIVNMSFTSQGAGGLISQAVDQLSTQAHVTVVCAAGNNAQDASNFEPGSSGMAIVVGGMDNDPWSGHDVAWASSNTGFRIDFYAPAVGIDAAGIGGFTATRKDMPDCFQSFYPGEYGCLSGTSFASPVVAGMAAIVLSQMRPAFGNNVNRGDIVNGKNQYLGLNSFSMNIWPQFAIGPYSKFIVQTYTPRIRP